MRYCLTFLFICLFWGLNGQGDPEERKRLAKELMLFSNYSEAIAVLYNDRELRLRDQETRFLMAVCYFQLNQLDEAETLLADQIEKAKDPYSECWLYLGKIYHARHQFTEAARFYKQYLQRLPEQAASRRMILDEIRRCSNGLQLQYDHSKAFVENLGPSVNSEWDEFGALSSPNYQTRLYFTSRRPGNTGGRRTAQGVIDEKYGTYFCDIFSADNDRGLWQGVRPMHHLVNSPRHEVLLGFSDNGGAMFYYQGNDWYNGSIIVDTFQQAEQRLLKSDPFLGPVDQAVDQAAPHFINRQAVIFSSRQPGGYGGLDLYITTFSNGRWSDPENLGPTINSPYDETTPFLAADGRTLYFSSNDRSRSIGGYDVFRTTYLSDHEAWITPRNMGLPINSAADDTHFRLANDGFSAFLTSSRKDGMGMRDIYVVYFEDFLREQEPPQLLTQTYYNQFLTPVSVEAPIGSTALNFDAPRGAISVVKPILFNEESEIFSPENRQTMDLVVQLLNDSGANLLITALENPGASVSETVYQALDLATPVMEYFLSKGISRERLILCGKSIDLSASGVSYNRAIDFFLSERPKSGSATEMQHLLPAVTAPEDQLIYRIQIAVFNGVFTGNLMNDFPAPVAERHFSRSFTSDHYYTGTFKTYAEAVAWRQNHLTRLGLGSAPIVPYIGEWRLNDATISQFLGNHPDLQNYIAGHSK